MRLGVPCVRVRQTRIACALTALAAFLVVLAWPSPPAAAAESFQASIRPLPPQARAQLTGRFWRPGCPVALSQLRLLTVTHWGFDARTHMGQLVVNEEAAPGLVRVFRRLHAQRFPIRHMRLADMYGPERAQPGDGDVTGSFECRQSVPSPCVGGSRSGRWSNHAYGLAIDVNPRENPYVGCGRTRDGTRAAYLDRSRLRRGMVTPAVVSAFRSIGWGWGGDWSGATKDYMHFSWNGR
jgi:D-alanyl-D-alanine carboxypeptidase